MCSFFLVELLDHLATSNTIYHCIFKVTFIRITKQYFHDIPLITESYSRLLQLTSKFIPSYDEREGLFVVKSMFQCIFIYRMGRKAVKVFVMNYCKVYA